MVKWVSYRALKKVCFSSHWDQPVAQIFRIAFENKKRGVGERKKSDRARERRRMRKMRLKESWTKRYCPFL